MEKQSFTEAVGGCGPRGSSGSSSPMLCVDKEEGKPIGAQDSSPTKMAASTVEEKEEEHERNHQQSSSQSEQDPDPMDTISREADPPSIYCSPSAAATCDGSHGQDSPVPSPPPEDTQETTPTKEGGQSSSEEESFDRVLRSAVRRSDMAVREERAREQFLVSWNLKMLKKPLTSG